MTLLRSAASLAIASTLLFLSGCSVSFNPADDSSTAAQVPISLQGSAFGGRQPIVGAHIFVFAAATTGYGATMAGAVGTASNSLLTSSTPNATLDSTAGSQTLNDYYLTTDANGAFTISGTYCTAGTQVYLYSTGGVATSGGAVNPQASLMAILGTCPAGGTFASTISYVYMNELTTVAAGYAIAGFAYDAVHVGSSGTALAQTGIANAFANANQLTNILNPNLSARATTPNGNGTVPQTLLNSIANMLVSCVNSVNTAATTSTPCNTIRAYATSDGAAGTLKASGTTNSGFSANAPLETASAIINLAHHPYNANVTTLFNQGAPVSNQVFVPILATAPADLTVQLVFTGTNFPAASSNFFPHELAVDASGNLWGIGSNTYLFKLSPLGVASSYNLGGTVTGIAIDNNVTPNIFVLNQISSASAKVFKFATSTTTTSTLSPTFGSKPGLADIAIDGSGNLWITDLVYSASSGGGLYKVSSAGSTLATNNTQVNQPAGVAVQSGAAGNVWLADVGGADVFANSTAARSASYINSAYAPLSNAIDSSGNVWNGEDNTTTALRKFTLAGATTSYTVTSNTTDLTSTAIDGGNNIWLAGALVIQEMSSAGVQKGSPTGFVLTKNGSFAAAPNNLALDGSGNIWYNSTTASDTGIREIIGSAIPVVTPIVAGVVTHQVDNRP